MATSKELCIFDKAFFDPRDFGVPEHVYRKEVKDGMIIEYDAAIPLRTGYRAFADIFRPEDESKKVAPLVAWTPYGKHGGLILKQLFPECGVEDDWVSKYTAFEAPDPAYWTKRGYAVVVIDIPGSWQGEGPVTYTDGTVEAECFYDAIEYLAKLPWSNGKVGLSGVSYLAVMQWHVAALNPPSLAAIHPDEGWTDFYREVARHGGIPCTGFYYYLVDRWNASINTSEQLKRETKENPFFNEFWETKRAKLENIKVPALITASFGDHALHTRGTFEGWKKISSKDKWLITHRRKKWAFYYTPEIVERQREFFDKFLLGKEKTEVDNWPRVWMEVPTGLYEGERRDENEWPLKRTVYTPYYLDGTNGSLDVSVPKTSAKVEYHGMGSDPVNIRQTFDIKFDKKTEITGHISANLFMETTEGIDMDVFVAVYKLDAKGRFVPQPVANVRLDGPVALGWLRASHRELDPEASTPQQPVYLHKRALPVKPNEVIELNIEVWTSSMTYLPGETLRFIVQGFDLYRVRWNEDEPDLCSKHEGDQFNKGYHSIHTGGQYKSHLLLPVIPNA